MRCVVVGQLLVHGLGAVRLLVALDVGLHGADAAPPLVDDAPLEDLHGDLVLTNGTGLLWRQRAVCDENARPHEHLRGHELARQVRKRNVEAQRDERPVLRPEAAPLPEHGCRWYSVR